MNLKAIFTAWNLSKELPKIAVCVLLGAALMLPLVCGKSVIIKEGRVVYLNRIDTLTRTITRTIHESQTIYIPEIRTVIDSSCWNSLHAVLGNDTLSIDSVNSCQGIYKGLRLAKAPDKNTLAALDSIGMLVDSLATIPFQPDLTYKSPFGYRVDAQFGASLFGGTVFAANARAWFGRWGLFVNPRLVLPAIEKSSFDGGVSYQIF